MIAAPGPVGRGDREVAARASWWWRAVARLATPPSGEGAGEVDRIRTARLHRVLVLTVGVFAGYGWTYLALGRATIGASNLLASIAALAIHAWTFRTPTPRSAAGTHLLAAVGVATFVVAARVSGGAMAMATWYLVLVPLFVGFVHDRRATLIWAGLTSAAILAVAVAAELWPTTPEFRPSLAELVSGQLTLAALLTTLAVLSRVAADERVAALAASQSQVLLGAAALSDARDAALASSRAKTEFLARMSHEIRTPLNGIVGMASVLLDAHADPELRRRLGTIRDSGQALRAIIDEILDFSRIEADRVELEERPFDVADCVEGALAICAPLAAQKQLELTYAIERGVPARMIGDPGRLRQILINLVGNGVKFTARGGVLVSISLRGRGRDKPDRLHIAVRDTGIGIPTERQAALFQPFQQVHASGDEPHAGTGLGLAIVARLAALMGGSCYVQSQVGVGSRFVVDLPMRAAGATRSRRARLDEAVRGRRVLLVEARPLTRRTLRLMLETMGASVQATSEVARAVEALARSAIDLVILGVAERRDPVLAMATADRATLRLVPFDHASGPGDVPEPIRRGALSVAIAGALGAPPSSPSGTASRTTAPTRRARVLVVEDNAINQQVASLMLARLGHTATVVADGAAAIAAVQAERYDVVLMDVRMPGMDGREATRQIRQLLHPELQPWIIACTANATIQDRTDCADAGMDAFLAKPIELAALAERMAAAEFDRGRDPSGVAPLAAAVAPPPAPAMAADEPTIDAAAFAQLRELCGDPAQLAELVRAHIANVSGLTGAVRAALDRDDRDALARAAHSIRGTTALFGARPLSTRAAELEAVATTATSAQLAGLVAQLDLAYAAAATALRARIG